ncbi:MAG: hypothetical protein J0L72_11040 [Armatimonadetes bacterium]|nr:hypothetical protein [Armatimonadota bacterium]
MSETEVISGRGQQVGSKSLVPARVINEPLVGQIQYGEDAYTEDWWLPAHSGWQPNPVTPSAYVLLSSCPANLR